MPTTTRSAAERSARQMLTEAIVRWPARLADIDKDQLAAWYVDEFRPAAAMLITNTMQEEGSGLGVDRGADEVPTTHDLEQAVVMLANHASALTAPEIEMVGEVAAAARRDTAVPAGQLRGFRALSLRIAGGADAAQPV